MTPEELIKLCDEAEKHNTGSVGRQKRIKTGIADLETTGFSTPARARSYAALWRTVEVLRRGVACSCGAEFQCGSHAMIDEALATTGGM